MKFQYKITLDNKVWDMLNSWASAFTDPDWTRAWIHLILEKCNK